jgi:serine/threonine-protein kinase
MKNCPRCHLPYPDEFSVCPKDGSVLQYLQEWQAGDVVCEKYRIIHKIGQGGMGAIYKAEHLVFEELRALKVLVPQLAHDEALVRFLQQEARITRRLSHPNAVRVEDVDRAEDGRLFIAMEYVEGKSIKKIIEQSGPIPVPRVIEIARQLCSALDCAHSLGMIHRDIKPDNLLLVRQPDDRDLVKVLDFGIAKLKESAKERGRDVTGVTMTKTGFVVGTPQYMSPEQAMGTPGDRLDGRSDLYSVGVLLYEALTGELPFRADTPMGYILQHVNTPPPSPLSLRPDLALPESVVNIVMKAMEKDPASRFQAAREMILALTAAAEAFEKDTVVKKIYTGRLQKARPSAVSAPPSVPTGHEEREGEEVPAQPPVIPVAHPVPLRDAGTGPPLSTPWDVTERVRGKPWILSPRRQIGRILTLAIQKPVWSGTAALLVIASALLWLWVASRRVPTAPSRPATSAGGGLEIQERKELPGQKPSAPEGQGRTHAPPSPPPNPQGGATATPRGAGAKPQAGKQQSPQGTRQRSKALSPDEQLMLKDKLVMGSFYMDRGDYDSAAQAYEEALKIDLKNAEARDGLQKARKLLDILQNKKKE